MLLVLCNELPSSFTQPWHWTACSTNIVGHGLIRINTLYFLERMDDVLDAADKFTGYAYICHWSIGLSYKKQTLKMPGVWVAASCMSCQ